MFAAAFGCFCRSKHERDLETPGQIRALAAGGRADESNDGNVFAGAPLRPSAEKPGRMTAGARGWKHRVGFRERGPFFVQFLPKSLANKPAIVVEVGARNINRLVTDVKVEACFSEFAGGDAGTMTYDFGTDVIQAGKTGDRSLHTVELTPELEGEWRVEDDFIDGVKSNGRMRPHPDFEDGLRYMRVVQAVADSRARNEWVEIERAS